MRILVSTAAILIVAAGAPATAAPPITKVEARQMSLEKTKRRVLDQLGDILVEEPRPEGRRRPTRPLNDLWFTTRPRAEGLRGMCAFDTVRVSFAPTNDQDLGADTPVRATGLSTTTRYALLQDPAAIEADDQEPRPSDERACRELSRDRYFEADDENTALELAIRLQLATHVAATVPVSCSGAQPVPDEVCRALIASFKLSDVWSTHVERVEHDARGVDTCWSYMLSEHELRVCGASGKREVARIEVNGTIVIADELVD